MAATASAAAAGTLASDTLSAAQTSELKGNINHAVVRWPYSDQSLEELAAAAREMGLKGIDYLPPDAWATLEKYDLICTMAQGPEGTNTSTGFNQLENHEWLIPGYKQRIQETAAAGYPNVIAFSGNANGLSDEEGLENCLEGIKQIMPAAEKYDITVCMELLNSKVDHPGYQCDTTDWGIELVDRVGSDNFKLLYDIYHVQIMEGDIIRTIRDYHEYFAHYHTAGVPGRNEINETQELYYPAIMEAIVETGFEGFVAQEFVPTGPPLESLREAIEICDV
jgi:hydroxypyruvate isomerase